MKAIVAIIGFIASVIGIVAFVTGKPSLPDFISADHRPNSQVASSVKLVVVSSGSDVLALDADFSFGSKSVVPKGNGDFHLGGWLRTVESGRPSIIPIGYVDWAELDARFLKASRSRSADLRIGESYLFDLGDNCFGLVQFTKVYAGTNIRPSERRYTFDWRFLKLGP